jgi:hypothetical protein
MEVNTSHSYQNINWIMVKLIHLHSGMIFHLFNVYMSNSYREKEECWESLLGLEGMGYAQNCIIVGDFNTTIHIKEKRGGSIVRDPFREKMEDLMTILDLVDVQPIKGQFTWNNRRVGPGHIVARLDHFIISSSFFSRDDIISSSIIPWASSDHRSISLSFVKEENMGPIPFRFNPLWMEREYFFPLITRTWSQWIKGSLVYIWEKKLKLTKEAIKQWVKTSTHSMNSDVKGYQKKMEEIQLKIDNQEVQIDLLQQEQSTYQSYLKSLKDEETMWRLKSRSLWLKDGDKNTSFFHKQARARQWRNRVEEIKTPSGGTTSSFEEIKIWPRLISTSYMQRIVTWMKDLCEQFISQIPMKISEEDNQYLNKLVTEEEIFSFIHQFNSDKSPGQMGLPFIFTKDVGNYKI